MTRALALLALLAACDPSETAPAPDPAPAQVAAPAPEAPKQGALLSRDSRPYAAVLAEVDGQIEAARALAEAQSDSWMRQEALAGLWMGRARLTGDLEDYGRAEAALDAAFAAAPEGAGPVMSRAQLRFALHRLDEVAADLDAYEQRVTLDEPQRAELLRRRANLAFQRGQYSQALAGYEASLVLHPSFAAVCDLAHYRRRTGDYDAAEALYDRAAGLYHGLSPEPVAWLALQRGLLDLDRGQPEAALGHLRDAEAAMPGWWLVEAQLAEVELRLGRAADAEARYRALVERTGNPEIMDKLAALLEAQRDEAGAAALAAEAGALYKAQLERFPEAAAGHAAGHELAFGAPARAVALAREDAALRPNGEVRLLLAEALLAAGEVEQARAEVEAVLASEWRGPALDEAVAGVNEAQALSALIGE